MSHVIEIYQVNVKFNKLSNLSSVIGTPIKLPEDNNAYILNNNRPLDRKAKSNKYGSIESQKEYGSIKGGKKAKTESKKKIKRNKKISKKNRAIIKLLSS